METSVNRAIMSGGIWVAMVYGLSAVQGINLSMMDVVVDAAIMGASAYSSDLAYSYAGMSPSVWQSAAGAGAAYTGIQYLYRGDSNFLVNFGMAAVNDYAVEVVGASLSSAPAAPKAAPKRK